MRKRRRSSLPAPLSAGAAHSVVVGGGLAGLVAGLLLLRRGERVVLVEREAACGGLLRSLDLPGGRSFDQGTHLARETGVPELDELLLGELAPRAWRSFDTLACGHHAAGRLQPDSAFLGLEALPAPLRARAAAELLALPLDAAQHVELASWLRARFGATLCEHVLEPLVLARTGRAARELAPELAPILGLTRVRAFAPQAARALKRSPRFDQRLAYPTQGEGWSGLRSYYPRRGGIGAWIAHLSERFEREGGLLFTGQSVRALKRQGARVRTVALSSGYLLPCDRLVWTLPASLCLRAAGLASEDARPAALDAELYHFEFDAAPAAALLYATNHDARLRCFRATLYTNLQARSPAPNAHLCSAEVLRSPDHPAAPEPERIADELRAMGLYPPSARARCLARQTLPSAFPIPGPSERSAAARVLAQARNACSNAHFLGRANGGFLMHEVALEVRAELAREAVVEPVDSRLEALSSVAHAS
jgi:hypothetical protein